MIRSGSKVVGDPASWPAGGLIGVGVLRLDMDGVALSNTWFAISPLNTAIDALWLLRQDASPLGGGWRTQVQEVVRNRGLTLLASLFGGSWDYVPDFLTPQPGAPEPTVQAELHALATTDSQRLQWEIALMFQGSTEHGMLGRPVPSVVRDALERGEHAFAERLASEIDQVWRPAIAPHWVSLRARMEADISQRAQTVARHGLSSMLTGLHPRVVWNVDHLQLMTRFRADLLDEGYDVTLQLSSAELPDSALVSQTLGWVHSVLCASPGYLSERGAPHSVAELVDHACLQLITPVFPRDRWHLEGPDGSETFELPPSTFQVNVADALAGALREGAGIGSLPMSSAVPALRSGSLLRVLPDYLLQKLTVYAMYASRQYLDAKIRTFVDFLKEFIPQALMADEAALQMPDHCSRAA